MNNRAITTVIVGLLITATAMAALIADRKQVVHQCHDVRVAMDGAIDAVVESGGLTTEKTAITLFREHNRKRIKIETIEVNASRSPASAEEIYRGQNIELKMRAQVDPKNGQRVASITGAINGENISAVLGCK